MSTTPAPIPVRIRTLIEDWISNKRFGRLAFEFKAGGISMVHKDEHVRPDELPLPPLSLPEPKKQTA